MRAMISNASSANTPDNSSPDAPWHVHLELRQEELLALQRAGLTGGAMAWRKGMQGWQPLGLPSAEPESSSRWLPERSSNSREESHSSSQSHRTRKAPPFKVGRNTPPLLSPVVVPLHPPGAREGSPSQDAAGVPVQAREAANYAPPLPELMSPPVSGLGLPVGSLPSFEGMPPSLGASLTGAQTGVSAVPTDRTYHAGSSQLASLQSALRAKLKNRATWLGAGALLLLSASNGALVSALIWSMRRSEAEKSAALTEQVVSVAREAAVAAAREVVERSSLGKAAAAATLSPAPEEVDRTTSEVNADDAGSNSRGAEQRGASRAKQPARLSAEQLPVTRKAGSESKAGEAKSSEARQLTGRSALDAAIARSQGISAPSDVAEKPARAGRNAGKAASKVVLTEDPPNKRASGAGPVDRQAIGNAVSRAAWAASSCGSGSHRGRVSLTFSPSGSVQSVQLVQSFQDANINACVLRAMGRAHVPAFVGAPVTVSKTISW